MLCNNKGDSTLIMSGIWHIICNIHWITFGLYKQSDLSCDKRNVQSLLGFPITNIDYYSVVLICALYNKL